MMGLPFLGTPRVPKCNVGKQGQPSQEPLVPSSTVSLREGMSAAYTQCSIFTKPRWPFLMTALGPGQGRTGQSRAYKVN